MKTKIHIKTIVSSLCLLVLTTLAPTVPAVALGGRSDAAFCSTLSNRSSAFETRFTKKQSALDAAWQKQAAKLQTVVSGEDTAIAKVRGNIDTQRGANQSSLAAKAQTDQQKAAVAAYVSAVVTAVQARRSAVDTARSTFRDGVKTLLVNHQAAASGRVSAFHIAVSDAYSTAQNSCTDDIEGNTVRATLLQDIATARQTFESQRTSDTVKADVESLVTARKQTIQTANNAFLQATQAAREALKTAFGSNI
jgi:hypothetical protein